MKKLNSHRRDKQVKVVGMVDTFDDLELHIDQLIQQYQLLREENKNLSLQVEQMKKERDYLAEKLSKVASRLEDLLTHFPTK